MITARVSRNVGDLHAANAVSSTRRLPIAGKIRPGIKVLTQAAAKVPGLSDIYHKGLAEGLSFDDIALRLKGAKGCPNYPLTPRNAPYFSVRQCDFATEGAAHALLDRYGSVRDGDPEKRLYSFPVIFPSDDIDLVFREQFEAWKASELVRWSEQDPQTGVLQCMRRTQAKPDPQARRRWGGRPTEAERPCDPNDCDRFGKGECKHVGSLYFWVPGVPGVGTIELTFTSIYASMGIVETLELVRMGLGRVSGLLPNGDPIFWISKRRERVSRMNWETAKPEKSDQWIIHLEASGLEMASVLSGSQREMLRLEQQAPQAPEPTPEPQALELAPAPTQEAVHTPATVAEMRKQVSALASTLDWSKDDLGEWIAHNYGSHDAARDPWALERMVEDLGALAATMAARPAEAAEPAAEPAEAAPDSDTAPAPAATEEAPF